ncbi:hypothetical protein K474DRAFT_1252544 [Panus rudis PR-1116 ss-1]|nr:hypothetical protein K474DRAFT_1252544 [Panus rudis PR-1116 ss-1]
MVQEYKGLTPEQVDFFLENGYVVIKQAFTKEQAAEWTKTMWVRLALDPADKSTWDRERIHMPWHKREKVASFAPKASHLLHRIKAEILTDTHAYQAWEAIKDLLGGEERIDEESSSWGDSFIVNFGTPELEKLDRDIAAPDLDNWHVDGDFFVHYLDSPEQALLVIPLYSDIKPRGGATYIATDGIDMIAKYLAAHPEGVLPISLSFVPSTSTAADPRDDPGYWSHLQEVKKCEKFVELTGEVGDVILLHPLMLHSASKNYLRIPRIITNPPVALKEPFNLNRENPEDLSLVERKTLKALGLDRLDFKPTTERRRIVPQRVLREQKMIEDEKRRLAMLADERKERADIRSNAQAISVA